MTPFHHEEVNLKSEKQQLDYPCMALSITAVDEVDLPSPDNTANSLRVRQRHGNQVAGSQLGPSSTSESVTPQSVNVSEGNKPTKRNSGE